MKQIFKVLSIAVVLFSMASCKPESNTDPQQNWEAGGQTIAYTVDRNISAMTLHSDAEWDDLMGKLMDYAQEGKAVSFYNTERSVKTASSKGDSKTNKTISTTDRQELKAWCRKMESEGKTVTIVYNKTTGVWSGTAYARSHHEATPSLVENYYYYGAGGEKIYCTIDTTSVFVAMSELADSVLLRQLLSMGDALQMYDNVIIIENLNVNYSILQNMLVNSGQLKVLSPAIHYRMYPSEVVFTVVERNQMSRFRQLVQDRNITILDSLPGNNYYLSSGSAFGVNSITMAADLYETGIFTDVVPSLIEVYVVDE